MGKNLKTKKIDLFSTTSSQQKAHKKQFTNSHSRNPSKSLKITKRKNPVSRELKPQTTHQSSQVIARSKTPFKKSFSPHPIIVARKPYTKQKAIGESDRKDTLRTLERRLASLIMMTPRNFRGRLHCGIMTISLPPPLSLSLSLTLLLPGS